MLASAWRFVKNNKKTILGTATIVGGVAVGLHSYVASFQQQWQTSASREFVSEVNRKGSHFDESIEFGNTIANRQYQEVVRKIRELFRIDEIFTAIKEAKAKGLSTKERLAEFEKLKLELFAYFTSEVIAITFFVTYLRVQLSMVSGKIYFDKKNESESEQDVQSNEPGENSHSPNGSNSGGNGNGNNMFVGSRYHLFVSLLDYFYQFGIEHLVNAVKRIVNESFETLPVTEKVTMKDLFEVLDSIKGTIFEQLDQLIGENTKLVFSMINGVQLDSEIDPNSALFAEAKHCVALKNEMMDIVRNDDFTKVIQSCASIGFSNMYDFFSECFVKAQLQSDRQESKKEFINPNKIVLPLVKLLPEIWANQQEVKASSQFDDSRRNRNSALVQYLLCSDSLTCFSANLYEAFCNENSNHRIF